MNTEHEFADTNRHLVEVPDTFAIARWPRDADVATIARCILGTLKYEPRSTPPRSTKSCGPSSGKRWRSRSTSRSSSRGSGVLGDRSNMERNTTCRLTTQP